MIRLMHTMAYGLISVYIYEIFKLREHLQPTTNCLGLYTYGLFGPKFPEQFWSYCMHRAHTHTLAYRIPNIETLNGMQPMAGSCTQVHVSLIFFHTRNY